MTRKYDQRVHPKIGKELASAGKTYKEIAQTLNISLCTFYSWQRKHIGFNRAVANRERKENHIRPEARPRNRRIGRRMRYCEACGVGIGIMAREEYASRYIFNSEACKICAAPAFDGGDYDFGV